MMKNPIYLTHFTVGKQFKVNPEILRIIVSKEYCRVDFGYATPWKYVRGGWIKIAPQTFIRVHGLEKKFALIQAENIPLAPVVREFESRQDWTVFQLYFEPIPLLDGTIDIIEQLHPNQNDFNYYDIAVRISESVEIIPFR